MFGLIDGNNFFVSCERIFRPDLLGKPVVVLSNNDGNIIARSNESKALGIAMGVPYFRVKTLLEHHKGIVFSSNFQLYRDISHRMMNMIESFVPGIEVYSIDEAFMDFKGYIDPLGQSHKIRQSILKSVGIPSSIGIGPTKTLAKVANRIAKQHPSFQHVCMLDSVDDINEALQSLDVSDIWGIGPKLTQHLRMSGIMTAYDLKCTAPSWARKRFSIVEERIVHELNGVSCLSFANIPDSPKSIQMTRSFGKNLQDIDDLQRVLCTYACRLGQKLRRYHLKTCTVLIYIKTNRFSIHKPQYNQSTCMTLPYGIQDDADLTRVVVKGLESIYKKGFDYHKAGVMALELIPENQTQLDFFNPLSGQMVRNKTLSFVTDLINKRYGHGAIYPGSCLKRLSWADDKRNVSPRYTTCWSDLPCVL